MTSTISNDDDEVSTVLRHFRPEPGFISSSRDHESRQIRTKKRQPNNGKKFQLLRGFSSVKYVDVASARTTAAAAGAPANHCNGGKVGGDVDVIQLTYLHVEHIDAQQQNGGSSSSSSSSSISLRTFTFLSFEIDLDAKSVACVRCVAPSISVAGLVQTHMNNLCEKEFLNHSLFSIASRLLQLLNNNFPSSILSLSLDGNNKNTNKESTFDAMVHRIASSAIRNCTRPKSRLYRLIDLQTLLIRCAAAGRQRSNVCTPVPVEFAHEAGREGDALARLVFDASNQLYLYGFRGKHLQQQQGRGHDTQQQEQEQSQSSEAWTLLPFLLSLPWIGGSQLKQSDTSHLNASSSSTTDGNDMTSSNKKAITSTSMVGKLCLEIQTSLGDPSPAFSRHAKKYGTVQAYHGTKIESAWSILNHGLQNLSYNAQLSQNGAMMGAGVYLSTSLSVAESFAIKAAKAPPRSLSLAFQHESLLLLLCYANVDIANLDPLDTYDIKCLPVFEATIIQPPLPNANESRGGGKCYTRQEGKYFVCSDSEFVRINKLHLSIELTKKSDIWKRLMLRLPLSVVVLLVALFWTMS